MCVADTGEAVRDENHAAPACAAICTPLVRPWHRAMRWVRPGLPAVHRDTCRALQPRVAIVRQKDPGRRGTGATAASASRAASVRRRRSHPRHARRATNVRRADRRNRDVRGGYYRALRGRRIGSCRIISTRSASESGAMSQRFISPHVMRLVLRCYRPAINFASVVLP